MSFTLQHANDIRMQENVIKPVASFEWHNHRQEASSKCLSEIQLSLNNLHEFHQPGKESKKEMVSKLLLREHKRAYTQPVHLKESKGILFQIKNFQLFHILETQNTFFCISNSNWIFSSVTILFLLSFFESGKVANIS